MPEAITARRQAKLVTTPVFVDKPPLACDPCQVDPVLNWTLLSGLQIFDEVAQTYVRLRRVRRVNETFDPVDFHHSATS
jgi:hypothetical protein